MSHGLLMFHHFVETLFQVSTSNGLLSFHHFVETLFQVITSHGLFSSDYNLFVYCFASFQVGFLLILILIVETQSLLNCATDPDFLRLSLF